jgi:hypothetical protein
VETRSGVKNPSFAGSSSSEAEFESVDPSLRRHLVECSMGTGATRVTF